MVKPEEQLGNHNYEVGTQNQPQVAGYQSGATTPQPPTNPQPPVQPYASAPNPIAKTRYPWFKDIFGIFLFIVAVVVGAWLINTLVFRSFSVTGPSMEDTFYTGDRIIVNRLPMTAAAVSGNEYVPPRGQIIVFKNPMFQPGMADEYIVKRVIGLPGERVVVNDCKAMVYNIDHPDGFNPYDNFDVADRTSCVTGDIERTVPEGEIFVIGDHRDGQHSLDSRNGLSTIPLDDVVGPVGMRIFPVNKIQVY